MTFTPNSPSELLAMQQEKQEPLTNTELVEKLCHHSDLQPTDLVEVFQLLAQKLLNFHSNVAAHELEENEGKMPSDKLFWVMDATKMQVIVNIAKSL